MTDNQTKEPWKDLLATARKAGATKEPDAESAPASPTFISSMRTVRETLWQVTKTMLWRRWSLVAIIIAFIIYLVAHLLLKPDPSPSIPPPKPPNPLSV